MGFVYDNKPLRDSIKKSATFPICTDYYDVNKKELKQPRLLTVSVDVEEGETVVFDSYPKEDGHRFTEYYQDDNSMEPQSHPIEGKIKISYDNGLMVKHIVASSSIPIHYDYAYVSITYDYDKNISDEDRDTKLERLKQQGATTKNYKRFWDGGITSNTPLRQLIQSHQDYWTKVEEVDKIPSLEVYIIDVWPSMVNKYYPIRPDHGSTINRKNELTYQDKTFYDENVANIVSDYYNLTRDLLELAEENNISKDKIDSILEQTGKSVHGNGKPRKYESLLKDRFEITKIIH
jgi:NTE family protein